MTQKDIAPNSPRPVPALEGRSCYSIPKASAPVDLKLDGNEGSKPSPELLQALAKNAVANMRQYPSSSALGEEVATFLGVTPENVLITAGADNALDCIIRSFLSPGREMILPVPTFEMLERFARFTGGTVITLPWNTPRYPLQAVLKEIRPNTSIIAVVSPNNPTGAIATADDVRTLARTAPHALILLDLAYTEFADEDLTALGLSIPNVVITRTFSKAWGLAGLRVGYAAGSAEIISTLKTANSPYAISQPSLVLAETRLREGKAEVEGFVQTVRLERKELENQLQKLGVSFKPSQANFVFIETNHALWVRDALSGFGIAVRCFPEHPLLSNALRISCPGDKDDFKRLAHALNAVFAPVAILFDMDGVLADVSMSYRKAILLTAEHFGVTLTKDDIAKAKAKGNANNDWELTWRLMSAAGVEREFEEVKSVFENFYQGTETSPGLRLEERLLISRTLLKELQTRFRLGIVTGRPRKDANCFLETHNIAQYFSKLVCMEDAPLKPNPAPVRLLQEQLGTTTAWLLGDTRDDIEAARQARVLPLGILAPGDEPESSTKTLLSAGAARVLNNVNELEDLLP